MSALYNYMEPFSVECRAFGRLQESGHEDLAVRCFGYVLLDEEHEHAMMTQCNLDKWSFNGDIDTAGYSDDAENRLRFLGKSGKPPPLRCIVKAFGQGVSESGEDSFGQGMARQLLRDIIKLQKLGIMQLDVGSRQMIDGRISDFSTAITMPHFITSPELNPHLTPAMIDAMKKSTFEHCMNDYLDFDSEVFESNLDYEEQKKDRISIQAYPGGRGCPKYARYNFRNEAITKRLYTFVDPRKYGWTARPVDAVTSRALTSKRRPERISKNDKRPASQGTNFKPRLRSLTARPDMWYYGYEDKDKTWDDETRGSVITIPHSLSWTYKKGYIFPVRSSGKEIT